MSKGVGSWAFFRLTVAIIISVFLLSLAEYCWAVEKLSNSDCVKCHPSVVEKNLQNGGKHKTEVKCLDCHKGHPPMVAKEKIIPKCSQCHSGKPHYALKDCLGCHKDPHTPLQITFAGDITGPCLTCHQAQGKELKDHPSKHTQLACTECHDVHKKIPNCLDCHEAHVEGQKMKDCLACHPAHSPLVITYGPDIPNAYCGACHEKVAQALQANKTKHHKLACVYCHKNRHGLVPQCQTCHGVPHSKEILKKFPKCVTCHVGAHNLVK
ncbi:cytochrome c family protein [Thermosulfidibacter takaii ABI70S6]|uniref:Cytochrome c family protein n=1 Tax=Thermosulfidibacter takaii (strain DSM 17441 / JCM 13301 / NBRC 103674 / ABI70S6) TaxID=1298851 RepID=A0A0S3QRQ5_THET7|nr:hypothetical protein [Thermosulfidibacter takaii]BAT71023.1 cytochrome c family protein [Thermosulfidibacter takaii ABI70S6]